MRSLFGCFLIAFMGCFYSYSYGQSPVSSIKGRVITAANSPAESVTVLLLTYPDSAVFKAAITGKNGIFSLNNIKPGNYIVYIHKIGYTKFYTGKYQLNGKDIALGDISLQELNKQLGEVTVTSKKDYVEVHPDKMVLNVDQNILATGNSVLDVLQTAPGVRIVDNAVLFKGGQKAIVAINGKSIGALTDEQLARMGVVDVGEVEPALVVPHVEIVEVAALDVELVAVGRGGDEREVSHGCSWFGRGEAITGGPGRPPSTASPSPWNSGLARRPKKKSLACGPIHR